MSRSKSVKNMNDAVVEEEVRGSLVAHIRAATFF